MDRTDYEEPRCPCDNSMWVKKDVIPIPSDRVIAREDEYLAKNDYASAERHLLYWWGEAEQGNDDRGKLLLCNELMGLYRKLGRGEKAMQYAMNAVELVNELQLTESVSGATAYLNTATVCKAFREPEKSLEYFNKCVAIYEKELSPDDMRKAGLYNNMALTMVDLGRYAEAEELYRKALDTVKGVSKMREAVTLLNLADCIVAEKGEEAAAEEVQTYIETAEKALDEVPETDWDTDYAFACEKCAPVFDYYGYFLAAKKFAARAEEIYNK